MRALTSWRRWGISPWLRGKQGILQRQTGLNDKGLAMIVDHADQPLTPLVAYSHVLRCGGGSEGRARLARHLALLTPITAHNARRVIELYRAVFRSIGSSGIGA